MSSFRAISALALLSSVTAAASSVAAAATPVTFTLDASRAVHEVSPAYLSANFDWHSNAEEWPAWNQSSAQVIDLDDADLRALAREFAPAYLRVGGSEGDCMIYEVSGGECAKYAPSPTSGFCYNNSVQSGFPDAFCLTMSRMDAILAFAADAGFGLAFGLNSMLNRASPTSRFDSSNVRALLQRMHDANSSAAFARTLIFEYGNEVQTKITSTTYAADLLVVRGLIDSIWADLAPADRPGLVCNDENPDPSYWSQLLPLVGKAVRAATWHSYYGYGLDPTLPSKAFNASFLAETPKQAAPMISVAADFVAGGGELWVGETAMAWHSGRNGTTDAYASGPWYINALGSLAATHSVFCRQTLLGGYYELVDRTTIQPNPDYFTALLWKRSMGSRVLSVSSSLPDNVLVYAHCAAAGGGVTLTFVNLDAETTYSVGVAGAPPLVPRSEWVLTPVGGDQSSRQVILNGVGGPLGVADGVVSPTPARVVTDPSEPWLLAPHTYGFVTLGAGAVWGVCS